MNPIESASPARAGMYLTRRRGWRSWSGFPRTRGDVPDTPSAMARSTALPPHARGCTRLLSESEWEYVARAGSVTRYWWGDDIGRNRANCMGCGSRWNDDDNLDEWGAAPVESFAANGFGLYDVHGNVAEWVQDCWNDSYAGAPGDGSAWENWESGADCSLRVLRGGSWYYDPRYLRAAFRFRLDTGNRDGVAGFRVARTFTP